MSRPIRTYRNSGLGTTRSDEEGRYRIKVKEPGSYRLAP